MKLFYDGANLDELKDCLLRGVIQGVTTNPTLLAKETRRDVVEICRDIAAVLTDKQYNPCKTQLPLSVEAVTEDLSEIVKQAEAMKTGVNYHYLNFKIPLGNTQDRPNSWNELEAIRQVSQIIPVNATCLYTARQALMAAQAGARYVSLFFARIRDSRGDPVLAIKEARALLENPALLPSNRAVEIIAGSIRTPEQAQEAWTAGAHIVTTGIAAIKELSYHPDSNKWVKKFLEDYTLWTTPKEV